MDYHSYLRTLDFELDRHKEKLAIGAGTQGHCIAEEVVG
jgi:hypothetical protein